MSADTDRSEESSTQIIGCGRRRRRRQGHHEEEEKKEGEEEEADRTRVGRTSCSLARILSLILRQMYFGGCRGGVSNRVCAGCTVR